MDNRPIGVFDSGLGGLTAVKELLEIMPQEDIVYFGDTGRVPYGSRSQEKMCIRDRPRLWGWTRIVLADSWGHPFGPPL